MPRFTLTDDDLPARHGHPAGTTATLDVLYDAAEPRTGLYPGSPEGAQILDITVDGELPGADLSTAIEAAWDEARLLDAIHDIQRGRADDAADHARDLQREDC